MKAVKAALTVSVKFSNRTGASFPANVKQTTFLSVSPPSILWSVQRDYSTNELSKNLQIISNDKVSIDKTCEFRLKVDTYNRPLVVMLPWLLAKQKHIMKFARFYLDQGYDVLKVSVSPWQLLWPVKGSQLVAEDMLQFLHLNHFYQPVLLHGFSVGAYLWGEALVKIKQDIELFEPVINRITGQIWDSAADVTELTKGLSKAIFPNNAVLRNACEKYIRYHLKTFHKSATIHYIRSSQMFHTSILRAPALMLLSKTDPIGYAESILRVRDNWDSIGITTYVKCWEKSPHVGHFRAHPEEYRAELNAFLDKLNVGQNFEKMEVKL